nr:uncharacterized protein LOC104103238 isoform X2 [Nicotiana tomentosiformis]
MDEPTKLSRPLNQPSAKAADYHPAFYEKRLDLNNDGLREARRDPGEPNSRSRYFFQTSGSKRHVCTCSDLSIGDALGDQEPKLHIDQPNLKGSIKYPGI